ncbi:cytochrome c [Thermomonas sp.]|uniref:c-type cytochrome n=1 Tax=Thermomonas sp. TaxID=1971895 RepID=UPI00261B5A3F|nr:cytochrome c [Thermomonas sp.]MCO5054007.1 cytochrome c [Thermomonas sp.]
MSPAMNKFAMTVLAVACALALSACSSSGESGHAVDAGNATVPARLPTGNIEAGRSLATKGDGSTAACVSCHGAEGNKPLADMYPKIGGQYADYLAHALQAYRSGARKGGTGEVMAAQAKGLSDQQIADLAAYFASVPPQLRDLENAN